MKIDFHFIAGVFNLAGFVALLAYLLKNTIHDYLKNRNEVFSEELKTANNGLLNAKTRFELATKRYIRANDDALSVERSMKHHADIISKRIVNNAEDEAERIIEASKTYSENFRKEMINKAKEKELMKISVLAKEKCLESLKNAELSNRLLKISIEKASKSFGADQ